MKKETAMKKSLCNFWTGNGMRLNIQENHGKNKNLRLSGSDVTVKMCWKSTTTEKSI
jgi:hypothetical protein